MESKNLVYVVYSPKEVKEEVVEWIKKKYSVQVCVKEYGKDGGHPHYNFIIRSEFKPKVVSWAIKRQWKLSSIEIVAKVVKSLPNICNYITKEENKEIEINELGDQLMKLAKLGEKAKKHKYMNTKETVEGRGRLL